MLLLESICDFLKDIFVELPVGEEFCLDLQFFFGFWRDLISLFKEMVNLIFALFKQEFKLFIFRVLVP
jgi:hypothetical protein